MALTQLNQLAIAFKKLAGKAHTNSSFGIGNEAIPSLLQVGTSTIFGEPIPSTGLPSSLYGINGTVEKIEFQLTEISAAQYLASNPGGLSGATINASGDGAPAGTFLNGIHAYKLSLPSDYESNSSNPKRGTAPFTNGSVVSDSNGGLQIIPDSFAAGYAAVVYDGTSVIFPGDQDDYYLDYSTGVLFIQDIVSGQPPVKVEAYLYIGKYLADPTLSYSGSFSGSFEGDGSGLTNVPASGVVGLNLTQIATSDVTASVQDSSNIFTVTSASQEVFNISDQGILSGSGANLYDIPASGIVGLNLSRTATGSVTASVDVGATPFTIESGSSNLVSVTSAGRIAVSKSINIGTPNLDPWGTGLDGSYFNNFNATDDVSDILRFMAGLLSASAPDAAPNTRTWQSTGIDFSIGGTTSKSSYMTGVLGGSTTYRNARLSQEWNQSNAINLGLTGSYRAVQSYLIEKGWLNNSETGSQALHDVGTHPFGLSTYGASIPSTIYNTFGTFTFNADSSVGSTTTVFSSSIGAQAFGLGRLINATTPTPYSLSIIYTQSFSDNSSDTTPGVSSTYSTGSSRLYTRSTAGNSNGLYLGIIETGNDLIPNAYQDAKFLNSPASFATRKWGDAGTNGAVTSSIGYYRLHGISVGLSSSLESGFVTKTTSPTAINGYYMPSLNNLGVQNITQNDSTVTISDSVDIATFTVVSRSLSGAPYILDVDYTVNYSTQVSKSFDPCYGYSQTPIAVSTPTDQWENIGGTTLSNTSVSVTTAGVQTSTANAGVFPAGGNPTTRRSTNDIPAIGDVAFLSSSVVFNLDSSFNNTVQSKTTQENLNYDLVFRTTGRNWKNASQTSNSTTQEFYDATRFGQPSTSGSMAIYSYSQTYDGGTYVRSNSGNLEADFTGENRRIQITDAVLSGSYSKGDQWSTAEAYNTLTGIDLQVKPGYLVRPGSTNGYWITDPDSGETYKYYAVGFTRNINSNQPTIQMTLAGNTSLVEWTSTTADSIAALFIPESALINDPSTARAWDFKSAATTVLAASNALNPFSRDLSVERNANAQKTNPFILTIDSNYPLDTDDRDFVILIRYNGNPTPLTSITLAVS